MFDMKIIGQRIADFRKRKNMTQNDIGQILHVSYQAVSKWERGETLPDIPVLIKLSELLDISIDNILIGAKTSIVKKVKLWLKKF